jgi:SAM-dependent methyltransferase
LSSPEFVERMLAPCTPMVFGQALDAGSGAGYDTFALADKFANVLAMDTDRDAVNAAKELARRAGVNNVQFTCTDVERLQLDATLDCLWCNGMSHNAHSRIRLFNTLMKMLTPGGWMMYAEVTEGFAIKEIARAIEARDVHELRMRVRQVIAGLLGVPRFRFFVSGSAERELSRLGLTVAGRTVDDWNGLGVFERVWGRASGPTQSDVVSEAGGIAPTAGDYTTMDPELQSVRSCAQAYLEMRKADGVGPATEMLRKFGETEVNRLAPLLLVFELAELLPFALSAKWSLPERLLARRGASSLDWSRVTAVHERLVALARERSAVRLAQ